jgi:hypothetical protein
MNLRNLYNALPLLEKDKSFFLGEEYTLIHWKALSGDLKWRQLKNNFKAVIFPISNTLVNG